MGVSSPALNSSYFSEELYSLCSAKLLDIDSFLGHMSELKVEIGVQGSWS